MQFCDNVWYFNAKEITKICSNSQHLGHFVSLLARCQKVCLCLKNVDTHQFIKNLLQNVAQ